MIPDLCWTVCRTLIEEEKPMKLIELEAVLGSSARKVMPGMQAFGLVDFGSGYCFSITEKGRLAWALEMARRNRLRAAGARISRQNINDWSAAQARPDRSEKARRASVTRRRNRRLKAEEAFA